MSFRFIRYRFFKMGLSVSSTWDVKSSNFSADQAISKCQSLCDSVLQGDYYIKVETRHGTSLQPEIYFRASEV
jgi:hypothetical protein